MPETVSGHLPLLGGGRICTETLAETQSKLCGGLLHRAVHQLNIQPDGTNLPNGRISAQYTGATPCDF